MYRLINQLSTTQDDWMLYDNTNGNDVVICFAQLTVSIVNNSNTSRGYAGFEVALVPSGQNPSAINASGSATNTYLNIGTSCHAYTYDNGAAVASIQTRSFLTIPHGYKLWLCAKANQGHMVTESIVFDLISEVPYCSTSGMQLATGSELPVSVSNWTYSGTVPTAVSAWTLDGPVSVDPFSWE